MEATTVIRKPIVTEKSTWEASRVIAGGKRQGESGNRFSFEVDMRARKEDIRAAVEEIYKVRVVKVATQVRKGRSKRTRYGMTRTPDWKKAVVQIHPEDRIELF